MAQTGQPSLVRAPDPWDAAQVRGLLAMVTVVAALTACSGEAPTGPSPPEQDELRLSQPRAVHRATLLADGTVLITGGCTEPGCGGFDAGRTADIYDPERGISAVATMSTPRASGTATLLEDGRVLLTGGYPGEGKPPTAAAEVFDPEAREFLRVDDLSAPRADHSASLLPDGRVLLAGGFDEAGQALSSTELFDPATGAFSLGHELSMPRAAHVAVTVREVVLLVGGTEQTEALATTDVFRTDGWRSGPELLTPRVKHGVAGIGGSRVLIVGGSREVEGHERLATTEVLDIHRGTVATGPRLSTGEYKLDGAVATLDDGRVVIPSGDRLEVYDPDTEVFTALDALIYDARSFRTVTPLGGNRVLVAGGYDDSITPTEAAVVVRIPRRTSAWTNSAAHLEIGRPACRLLSEQHGGPVREPTSSTAVL